jgi:hypothetical protein
LVRSSNDGSVPKPALNGVDEVMVSATWVVTSSVSQAPTTLGSTGASCGHSAGQADPPLAIQEMNSAGCPDWKSHVLISIREL